MRRTAFVALAAVGLALSLVLEYLHVRAHLRPTLDSFCSLGQRLDCTSIALSRWSVVLSVPVPLWGALGFISIGMAAWRRSRWLLPLTGIAALVSVALLLLELLAVGVLCLLCEGVHLLGFVLFGLALYERKALRAALWDRDDIVVIFAPPLGALLGLVLFLPHYWGAYSWRGELPFPHGKTSEGYPWIGAVSPKVTLDEFTDYRCAHCKAASARNARRLAEHPQSFRIVRRQFPRARCPKSPGVVCLPVRMAYCSEEQGKFWQADRWLFEHASERLTAANLTREVRLDLPSFERCLGREDVSARAARESAFALGQKFSGAPTFVVHGARISESALEGLLAGLR